MRRWPKRIRNKVQNSFWNETLRKKRTQKKECSKGRQWNAQGTYLTPNLLKIKARFNLHFVPATAPQPDELTQVSSRKLWARFPNSQRNAGRKENGSMLRTTGHQNPWRHGNKKVGKRSAQSHTTPWHQLQIFQSQSPCRRDLVAQEENPCSRDYQGTKNPLVHVHPFPGHCP